jgi:four helix bundle protein
MSEIDLPRRTREFARRTIEFSRTFPAETAARVISYQLIKAVTSVGANCSEASFASSRKDFINKISLSTKECAEAEYWLSLCRDVNVGSDQVCGALMSEARELLAILVAVGRNAKRNAQ